MKVKIKKIMSIVLTGLMLLLLSGCGSAGSAASTLRLDQFKTEGIGYCYKGIDWYVSEAEFESASGMKLSDLEKMDMSQYDKNVYMTDRVIEYNGEKGYETIEFLEGKLKSVTFTLNLFEKYAPEELFQELTTECEKIYGSPDDILENSLDLGNGAVLKSHTYKWYFQTANGNTSLQVMYTVEEGDNSTHDIILGVAIF